MKKLKKNECDKECTRGKELKMEQQQDGSKKVKHVRKNSNVCMCGKQPKVYRFQNSGTGLPKWKKR